MFQTTCVMSGSDVQITSEKTSFKFLHLL